MNRILLTVFYFILLSILANFKAIAQSKPSHRLDIEKAQETWGKGNKNDAIKQYLDLLYYPEDLSRLERHEVYGELSEKLYDIHEYDAALEYSKKWHAIHPIAKEIPNIGNNVLAKFFSATGQHDSALYYMKKRIPGLLNYTTYAEKRNLLMSYNNIGYTSFLNDQFDSAQVYYKKVINYDDVFESYPGLYGLTVGNLGNLYQVNGNYEKALELTKIDLELNKNIIKYSYHNALIGVATCYYHLDSLHKSEQTLNDFFSDTGKEISPLLKAHQLMADIQKELGNYKNATTHLENYIRLKDSVTSSQKFHKEIAHQYSKVRFQFIEKDLELSKKETALTLARKSAQAFRYKIYLTFAIIIVVIIIFLFFVFKKAQKRKHALQRVQNKLLESELKNKQKDLSNFSTNLIYKRKFIDETQKKLKEIRKEPQTEMSQKILELIREFNNYASIDENIKSLQLDIDKVNSSFFEKLGNSFPALTQNEKELCGLLVLNFSSKDIAHLRNITPNAVKKARQTIRKKLPITATENLSNFLSNIN